jgi:ferredoxin
MLDVLLDSGAEVAHSYIDGICGSCQVQVLDVLTTETNTSRTLKRHPTA